jgi:geranylgeranyl pyrophosphate synthase
LAYDFGLLFQIADDVVDVEQDKMRSSANVDVNFVLQHGMKETLRFCKVDLRERIRKSSNKVGVGENLVLKEATCHLIQTVHSYAKCYEKFGVSL